MKKKNFYAGTYYSPKTYSGVSIDTCLTNLTLPDWGIWVDFLPARLTDLISRKTQGISGPLCFDRRHIKLKYIAFRKGAMDMDNSRMKAVCNWTLCSAAVNTMWYWTVRHPMKPNSSRQLGSKWLLKNAGDLDLNKLEYTYRKDRAVKCPTRHMKALRDTRA